MGVVYVCDGCEKALQDEEPQEMGLVHKVRYCASCAGDALRYIYERDQLHTSLATMWQRGHLGLRLEWKKKHPNGVLPDEPES